MKKAKVALVGLVVLLMLACGSKVFTASAGPDFASMSKRDFILFMMDRPNYNEYSMYFPDAGFQAKHEWFTHAQGLNGVNKLDSTYPWEAISDREYEYIVKQKKMVDFGRAGDSFQARADRYNREHGVYEAWAEQMEISANRKMWAQSQLVGNPNSHGMLTQKDETIYERQEGGVTVEGIDLGAGSYNMDEPSGVTKVIMEFLCWLIFFLADGIDSILSNGGIALDNVIFGRVAGYGVLPAGETEYITLFGFELNNGNPYGYVGAMLFQKIRSYIYLFMAVYCLYKMVRIAASTDYMKMKMDFSTFLQNALLSFSFIVLMPYIFDVYLYVRDVLLKSVTFGSLQDLFGTTGFLASFRAAAESSSLNIIPNLIYLGAVVLSLVVAGIYIAYAMSMMVHFILFPFVCLRGIGDRNAYKEWATETLGLTIMPLIDGILLIIPLTFSDMANGNLAFNLLSLVSCGMLLTARKQARRSLGIKDTGLDMGAMATVMGLGAMVKGIGRTIGKVGKKMGEARESNKAAQEDDNMADFYENEAKAGRVEAPRSGGSKATPEPGVSPGGFGMDNLKQHANIDNFENGPFKGNLDNETMANLYRERAKKRRMTSTKQTLGAMATAAGGVGGLAAGFGAGAFMGSGARMYLAGAGMEAGSAIGGTVGEYASGKIIDWMNTDSGAAGVSADGGAAADASGPIDGGEVIVPASDGASTGSGGVVGVDMVNADGRRAREEEFEKLHGEEYRACAAEAAQKMDVATLSGDERYTDMVAQVKLRYEQIKSNAQSGNFSPEVVFSDFNGLHKDFRGKKEDFFHEATIEVGNSMLGKDSFNMDCQTDRDLIGRKVRELTRSGGKLTQDGAYMTNSFDKKFDVTWYKWEQELRSEFEKQGYYYDGGKK